VFYSEYTCYLPIHSDPEVPITVLLFEFVEDPDLTKLDPKQHSADELKALQRTALLVLQKIHSQGVYHHDIRLSNLLSGGERVIFVDFDRAVFKDTKFVETISDGVRYMEANDKALMDEAFERWDLPS
jgi:tRNA A-37 threonylcarbamoyl transferase component Bud32